MTWLRISDCLSGLGSSVPTLITDTNQLMRVISGRGHLVHPVVETDCC